MVKSSDTGRSGNSSRSPQPKLSARQNAQLRENFVRSMAMAGTNETALAKSIGVARHTLTSIGRSASGPHLATLLLVAQELGLYSMDELLGSSSLQRMSETVEGPEVPNGNQDP